MRKAASLKLKMGELHVSVNYPPLCRNFCQSKSVTKLGKMVSAWAFVKPRGCHLEAVNERMESTRRSSVHDVRGAAMEFQVCSPLGLSLVW